ncbi:hypothetical protein Athai_67270 [Actinocatenispora thailandica]|uniref:DUF3558 domain-containing protein n=1 Tax=Actinocatenispora thailandica TaxID=227318 RepID=A0A7R7DWL1_9ACTN|nr:hypothetical protein [Actinocatenispora thailandica]BCJ39224.1 hypothetical protein Athai_67270 [Actinocatenispora thailandica]
MVLAAGGTITAYYRGAFAKDGPYTSIPNPCDLMHGDAFTHYFSEGRRSDLGMDDGEDTCDIDWKRGTDIPPRDRAMVSLSIKLFHHRGHVDATDVAIADLNKEFNFDTTIHTDSRGYTCTPTMSDYGAGAGAVCIVGNLRLELDADLVTKPDPVQTVTDLLKPVLDNMSSA